MKTKPAARHYGAKLCQSPGIEVGLKGTRGYIQKPLLEQVCASRE